MTTRVSTRRKLFVVETAIRPAVLVLLDVIHRRSLRLHSRAHRVFNSVQPEHQVVLSAGQLLPSLFSIARGHPDAIKVRCSKKKALGHPGLFRSSVKLAGIALVEQSS